MRLNSKVSQGIAKLSRRIILTSLQFLAYYALIWATGTSATQPQSCQANAKVFVIGYPNPECVVTSTKGVEILLTQFFLANGGCEDSSAAVLGFRHAISNDVYASRCVLSYWSEKGCLGTAKSVQAHAESEYNSCVSVSLVPSVTGAASFSLACN